MPITRSFLLKYGDVEKLRRTYVRDISKGGMFVRSRAPQPKGTRVRVVIGLPDGSRFPLEGEVVDVRERSDGSGGNGIRFSELDDARLAMLESYIDACAAGVPQPILGDDSDISLINVIEPEVERKLRSQVSVAAKRVPATGLPRVGAAEPPSPDLVLRLDRALRQIEPLPSSDPYEVLGLEAHAVTDDILVVLQRRLGELAHDPGAGKLPTRLNTRLEEARGKLNLAAETLLEPSTRAVQDLALGALLPATEDPAVRRAFEQELERRAAGATAAERAEFELATPIVALAREKQAQGELAAARALYRAALLYDPHNLKLRELAAELRARVDRDTSVSPSTPPPPPLAAPHRPSSGPDGKRASWDQMVDAGGPDDAEPITMELDPEPSEVVPMANVVEPARVVMGIEESPPKSRSRIGLVLGVGALAAAAAVGLLVMGAEDAPALAPAEEASVADPVRDEGAAAPTTVSAPEADTEAEAEAEVEAEPEAVAVPEAEAEAEAEPVPEAEVEADAEPGPTQQAAGPLAEAQRAFDAGEFQKAIDLATAASAGRNERFMLTTLAACKLDDGVKAREAFRPLVGRNTRRQIGDACAEVGINVFAKGAGYTADELLRHAKKARAAGDAAESCRLASLSNKKSSGADAMQILGICACESGSKTRARHFLKFLSDESDAPIIEACLAQGIEL